MEINMKKINLMVTILLISIGTAFGGYQSTSISSSCFFSCETKVKINGVERVFEGVKSAEILDGTGYLLIDGGKFVMWPDGDIIDADQLKKDCPTCAKAYEEKLSISPEASEFCYSNFFGSKENECKEIVKDVDNFDELQIIADSCEDIYTFTDATLNCLDDVVSGELDGEKVINCSENNTFSTEKKECLK
jgi:hypothetical protein